MSEDPKPPSAGSPAAPGFEALAELETALREATGLLKSLKAENERLKRRNAESSALTANRKARSDRLLARADEGEAGLDAAGPTAQAPASVLAERVMELEELRRGWLRDRRRLAERVEGILDKLEYLQSESNSN